MSDLCIVANQLNVNVEGIVTSKPEIIANDLQKFNTIQCYAFGLLEA